MTRKVISLAFFIEQGQGGFRLFAGFDDLFLFDFFRKLFVDLLHVLPDELLGRLIRKFIEVLIP